MKTSTIFPMYTIHIKHHFNLQNCMPLAYSFYSEYNNKKKNEMKQIKLSAHFVHRAHSE